MSYSSRSTLYDSRNMDTSSQAVEKVTNQHSSQVYADNSLMVPTTSGYRLGSTCDYDRLRAEISSNNSLYASRPYLRAFRPSQEIYEDTSKKAMTLGELEELYSRKKKHQVEVVNHPISTVSKTNNRVRDAAQGEVVNLLAQMKDERLQVEQSAKCIRELYESSALARKFDRKVIYTLRSENEALRHVNQNLVDTLKETEDSTGMSKDGQLLLKEEVCKNGEHAESRKKNIYHNEGEIGKAQAKHKDTNNVQNYTKDDAALTNETLEQVNSQSVAFMQANPEHGGDFQCYRPQYKNIQSALHNEDALSKKDTLYSEKLQDEYNISTNRDDKFMLDNAKKGEKLTKNISGQTDISDAQQKSAQNISKETQRCIEELMLEVQMTKDLGEGSQRQIEQLKKDINQYMNLNENSQRQIEELKYEKEVVMTTNEDAQRQVEGLVTNIEELRKVNTDLHRQFEYLQSQVEETKDDKEKTVLKISTLIAEIEGYRNDNENDERRIAALNAELTDSRNISEEAKRQINVLVLENEKATSANKESQTHIDDLVKGIEKHRGATKDNLQQIEKLKAEIEQAKEVDEITQRKIRILVSEKEAANTANERENQRVEQLSSQIEQMKSTNEDSQRQIEKLKDEIEQMKSVNEDVQKKIGVLVSEKEAANTTNERENQRVEQLKYQIQQMKNTNEDSQRNIEKLQDEIEQMTNINEDVQRKIHMLVSEKEAANTANEREKRGTEQLNYQIEQMKNTNEDSQREIEKLKDEIERMKCVNEDAQRKIGMLVSEKEAANTANERENQRIEQLNYQIEQMKSTNEDSQRQIEKLKDEIEQMTNINEDAQRKIGMLVSEKEAANTANERENQRIEQLNYQIEQMKNTNEASQRDMQELKTECKTLSGENTMIRREFANLMSSLKRVNKVSGVPKEKIFLEKGNMRNLIDLARKEVEIFSEEMKELKNKNERLAAQCTVFDVEREGASEAIEDLKDKNEKLVTRYKGVADEVAELDTIIDKMKDENTVLNAKNSDSCMLIERLQVDIQTYRREIDTLKKEIVSLKKGEKVVTSKEAKCDPSNASRIVDCLSNVDNSDKFNADYQKLKLENDNLKSDNGKLKTEVETLKKDIVKTWKDARMLKDYCVDDKSENASVVKENSLVRRINNNRMLERSTSVKDDNQRNAEDRLIISHPEGLEKETRLSNEVVLTVKVYEKRQVDGLTAFNSCFTEKDTGLPSSESSMSSGSIIEGPPMNTEEEN